MFDITTTFLDLGDRTSRNLEFSHQDNVHISYGEETITESNLLEIRRRHPEFVKICTFTKRKEAESGADWEWHIVGRIWTYKMRVQAKRVQRDDKLKVCHEVKSSGKQQRDLLIEKANDFNMDPVYCIYSTDHQRKIWRSDEPSRDDREFQAGCLLAAASDVPLTVKRLVDI